MSGIDELEVAIKEVVDYMRISGTFAPALQEVINRKITAKAAKDSRLTVSDKELQKGADTYRLLNNMKGASDTEEWLKSNGISLEAFEEYLETNILISKFKDYLEKKTKKEIFINSENIKESLREMIYQDWLKKQLK